MAYFWVILTLLSALFVSIANILTKKTLGKNTNPTQIIFEQYFLMFIFVSIIFFNLVVFVSFLKYWKLYLLKAGTIFIFTILYFKLLKEYDISKITPLMNVSPIFLLLLSSILLNEIITFRQFFGIIIIILSTYILEVNINFHHKKNPHKYHLKWFLNLNLKPIIIGLFMLFDISITAISDKMIFNQGVNVYTNMFFTGFIIFFSLSIFYIKKKYFLKAFYYFKKEPIIFIISIFSLISTFFVLLAISLPGAMVSLIVPLKRTSTLFSAIIGGIIFHEDHLIKKFFSIIFMILGIILLVI